MMAMVVAMALLALNIPVAMAAPTSEQGQQSFCRLRWFCGRGGEGVEWG